MSNNIGIAVHEAGHWVAAQMLGANPTRVLLHKEEISVEVSITHRDPRILAAGYAAEALIFGRVAATSDDAARILALGMAVDDAVKRVMTLIAPHYIDIVCVASAIEAADDANRAQITREELEPYYTTVPFSTD